MRNVEFEGGARIGVTDGVRRDRDIRYGGLPAHMPSVATESARDSPEAAASGSSHRGKSLRRGHADMAARCLETTLVVSVARDPSHTLSRKRPGGAGFPDFFARHRDTLEYPSWSITGIVAHRGRRRASGRPEGLSDSRRAGHGFAAQPSLRIRSSARRSAFVGRGPPRGAGASSAAGAARSS